MIAEASRDLYENRLKFQADYMEYVMKLNEIEAKKKFDFVENVRVFPHESIYDPYADAHYFGKQILGYMYTSSVFHHQGYEILKDLEPYMRDLTGMAVVCYTLWNWLLLTHTSILIHPRTFARCKLFLLKYLAT